MQTGHWNRADVFIYDQRTFRCFWPFCHPQSEQDENMIEMAGDDVDVPEELLKMVDEDATEEEGKDSIMGQFQNLQNMDMDQLKEKASATVTELKSKAEEKCSVM